jgi:hypothetical protein
MTIGNLSRLIHAWAGSTRKKQKAGELKRAILDKNGVEMAVEALMKTGDEA